MKHLISWLALLLGLAMIAGGVAGFFNGELIRSDRGWAQLIGAPTAAVAGLMIAVLTLEELGLRRVGAWLVLALGLAMFAIGATAIVNGWEIVQSERGWAQVIAGAAAASAGGLTLALALAVAKLESLRRAILQSAQAPVRLVPMPSREAAMSAVPEQPDPFAKSASRGLEIAGAAGAVGAVGAAFAYAHSPPSEPPAAASEPAREIAIDFARLEEDLSPEAPVAAPPAQIEAAAPVEEPPAVVFESDPLAELSLRSLHLEAQARIPAVEAKAPAATPATPSPKVEDLDDDWLDQALAGKHDEPAPAPRPPDLPVVPPPPPSSAIIARYDAGGVAYVMYEDGSIDADDGFAVRHFRDMAELKAHLASAAV